MEYLSLTGRVDMSNTNLTSLLSQIAKEKCANSYTDYDVLESHGQPHSEETLHIEVFFLSSL